MSLRILEDLVQGSEAWHAARRGMVTASIVGKLITIGSPDAITVACPTCSAAPESPCFSMAAKKAPTPIKTIHESRAAAAAEMPPTYSATDSETARTIAAVLAAERIAGWTEDTPISSDMWRGIDAEPIARQIYAKNTAAKVEEIGFMIRTEPGWTLGYSPDGLVGDDGLLEIKAPRAKTHLLTVIAGEVPAYNMAQLQAGLLVSGRRWIDFVPYVGGLPLWTKRVYPDAAWQDAIVAATTVAEQRINHMVDAYRAATTNLPATEQVDFNNVELKLA